MFSVMDQKAKDQVRTFIKRANFETISILG
jgi:hypothetical protein